MCLHNCLLHKSVNLIITIMVLFMSRLSLIVRVNVVLNRTIVFDSDGRFDNLCGSNLLSHAFFMLFFLGHGTYLCRSVSGGSLGLF